MPENRMGQASSAILGFTTARSHLVTICNLGVFALVFESFTRSFRKTFLFFETYIEQLTSSGGGSWISEMGGRQSQQIFAPPLPKKLLHKNEKLGADEWWIYILHFWTAPPSPPPHTPFLGPISFISCNFRRNLAE